MRERRDPTGRMPHQIYFEDGEIDSIMEDELLKSGRRHRDRGTVVDMDSFIEHHLGITPSYVELPAGVQGATDFAPSGKVAMRICAELGDRAAGREPGAEHLMRTTLAHEAAHVLLHRSLYLKQSEALFGNGASKGTLCRDVSPNGGYNGEWWEWQANQGMGALLLPRREMKSFLASHHIASERGDDSVVRDVAQRYDVSTQVVRYRFEQLSGSQNRAQTKLEI